VGDGGSCGGKDEACCGTGNICTTAGLTCAGTDGGEACQECGGDGQPCCRTGNTRTCDNANLVCETNGGGPNANGTCHACGQRNQACCGTGLNRTCATGLNCRNNDAPIGSMMTTCQ
jgi:hypothetical protein